MDMFLKNDHARQSQRKAVREFWTKHLKDLEEQKISFRWEGWN